MTALKQTEQFSITYCTRELFYVVSVLKIKDIHMLGDLFPCFCILDQVTSVLLHKTPRVTAACYNSSPDLIRFQLDNFKAVSISKMLLSLSLHALST